MSQKRVRGLGILLKKRNIRFLILSNSFTRLRKSRVNRLIIFTLFFGLIFLWALSRMNPFELDDNSFLFRIRKSHLFEEEEEVWSPPKFDKVHLKLLGSKLSDIRARARIENMDEFMEDVIKELPFEEIDLISAALQNEGQEFDSEIRRDFRKIVRGWGEAGDPVYTDNPNFFSMETREGMQEWIRKEGFNLPLSQQISPNRTLADSRPFGCEEEVYDRDLPKMSVVIIFHNEPMTTLMRTVHSVVNRTPPQLLQEVVLVDDVSNYTDVSGVLLERYLITQFPHGLLRLVRLRKRAGLIKARMVGAHFATGEVLFFLDSHMELERRWAEPLLQRIKENPQTLISPVIKSIEPNYLSYLHDPSVYISGFHWDGWFHWIDIPPYENERKEHVWSSTRSPTMMGAAFAINRKYFWMIGSFDPGMEIWGGENLELPFRVMMCGGSNEIHPCSRVGHLYRVVHTYDWTFGKNKTETLILNMARTAEIWMDEFKELFYLHYNFIKDIQFGDVSKRVALRKRLNCKSFRWFMDNFYKEKFRGHLDARIAGQFKSDWNGKCLDSLRQYPDYDLGLFKCYKFYPGNTQILYLTHSNVLRLGEAGCLKSSSEEVEDEFEKDTPPIRVVKCSNLSLDEMEKWEYNNQTKQILHLATRKCVTIDVDLRSLTLGKCSPNLRNQRWTFIPIKLRKRG